jgi:hypothetical protein
MSTRFSRLFGAAISNNEQLQMAMSCVLMSHPHCDMMDQLLVPAKKSF